VLALYSTNARGYSIVGLAFLGPGAFATRLLRAPSTATGCIAVVPHLASGRSGDAVSAGRVALWLALSFAG